MCFTNISLSYINFDYHFSLGRSPKFLCCWTHQIFLFDSSFSVFLEAVSLKLRLYKYSPIFSPAIFIVICFKLRSLIHLGFFCYLFILKREVFFLFLFLLFFPAVLGLCCSTWTSHCCGFSFCRAQPLGTWASVVVLCGLNCPKTCRIFPDQVLNLCALHWQVDS